MSENQARPIAVVTGSSSGIGAATARALAADGFQVICAARRLDRLQSLAEEIGGLAVACDVTDADQVAQLAQVAGPSVAVLVNNAGGALGLETIEAADLEDWRAMYATNVLGVVQVTRALLPALRSAHGAVITVGSTAGGTSYERGAGYVAAKHGTRVVVETLRLERPR